MVWGVIVGCSQDNGSEQRVYGAIDYTDSISAGGMSEDNLREHIQSLRFLTRNNEINSIVFEHSKTEPVNRTFKFLGMKFNSWKSAESLERRYEYNRGEIYLNSEEEASEEEQTQTHRNKIKNYLLNVVLNPRVQQKQISGIPFSSWPSQPIVQRATHISSALGGRGHRGHLIKVVHGTSRGGQQNDAVYYFSFDVPLEANPIFEGRSSLNNSGKTFRYKYLSRATIGRE